MTTPAPYAVGEGFPDVVATVFRAAGFVVNQSGAFFYSGTPANGNLIVSIAPAAGTDPYGNSYPQGLSVTLGAISGSTFSGTDFVINSSGAFFYGGTPAAGNLLLSIAPASGSDSFGNAYPQGISIADPAVIKFPSGANYELVPANITSSTGGSPAFIQMLLSGPKTNVSGHEDWVQIEMNSANSSGTSSANCDFNYVGTGGTVHEYAFLDDTGFNIQVGSATGAHPGSTPLVAETWQSAAAGGSPAWSGTVFYKMCLENEVMIVAQLTAPSSTPINNNTIVTLPSAYRPTTSGIQFGITSSSGTNATATLGTDGTIHTNGVSTTGSTVWIGPIRIPLDV